MICCNKWSLGKVDLYAKNFHSTFKSYFKKIQVTQFDILFNSTLTQGLTPRNPMSQGPTPSNIMFQGLRQCKSMSQGLTTSNVLLQATLRVTQCLTRSNTM